MKVAGLNDKYFFSDYLKSDSGFKITLVLNTIDSLVEDHRIIIIDLKDQKVINEFWVDDYVYLDQAVFNEADSTLIYQSGKWWNLKVF